MKSEALWADLQYQIQIAKGKQLLKTISTDEQELAIILGEQYQSIREALGLVSEAALEPKMETTAQNEAHAAQEGSGSEIPKKRKHAATGGDVVMA